MDIHVTCHRAMSKDMNPSLCVQTHVNLLRYLRLPVKNEALEHFTHEKLLAREMTRKKTHVSSFTAWTMRQVVSVRMFHLKKILNEFQWNLVLAVCNKTCGSAHNGPIHDVQNKLNSQYIHNTYYGNLIKLRLWLIVIHSIHCQYHIIPYLTNLHCISTKL